MKKSKRLKELTGNYFFYKLLLFIFNIYLRLFKGLGSIDRSGIKDMEGPYLVVANHQSFWDFGAVAITCLPTQLTFVVSAHFFHSGFVGWFLSKMKCISRKQFVPDTVSIRKIMRVVKAGGSICIFPEGQTSYSGKNAEIDLSIGKLAKSLHIPVVNVRVRGNHLSFPKWSNRTFRGYTEASASVLISREQLERMTDIEVGEAIAAGIAYDEYGWQKENLRPSRTPRTLEGMENITVMCPKCGKMRTMSSKGNRLWCSSCGYSVHADQYGLLRSEENEVIFDTPSAWVTWQETQIKNMFESGTLLPIVSTGRFLVSAKGKYEEHGYNAEGKGTITLDETGMTFTGTRNGKDLTLHVSPAYQRNLTFNAQLWAFDISGDPSSEEDYAFDPDISSDMMKIIEAWPLVRDKYFST